MTAMKKKIKIQQNLYLTFSKICVIINMLSGEDKAIAPIGESPMAQHSPGATFKITALVWRVALIQ